MQIWCLWCVWNNVLKPAVQSVIFVSIMRSPPLPPPITLFTVILCPFVDWMCICCNKRNKKKNRWHQLVQHTKNNNLPHKLHWCFRAHCTTPPWCISLYAGNMRSTAVGHFILKRRAETTKSFFSKLGSLCLANFALLLLKFCHPFSPPLVVSITMRLTHARVHTNTNTLLGRDEIKIQFSLCSEIKGEFSEGTQSQRLKHFKWLFSSPNKHWNVILKRFELLLMGLFFFFLNDCSSGLLCSI